MWHDKDPSPRCKNEEDEQRPRIFIQRMIDKIIGFIFVVSAVFQPLNGTWRRLNISEIKFSSWTYNNRLFLYVCFWFFFTCFCITIKGEKIRIRYQRWIWTPQKMNAAGVCYPSSYIKGVMSKHIYFRFIWIHNTDFKKVNLYK